MGGKQEEFSFGLSASTLFAGPHSRKVSMQLPESW